MVYRVIEFAATPGDDIVSPRVRLGDRLSGFSMRLAYRRLGLQGPAWYFSIGLNGRLIRDGIVVRERVDLLSGVAGRGRPPGSIVAVRVNISGNGLDATAFSDRRYELRYYIERIPGGVL